MNNQNISLPLLPSMRIVPEDDRLDFLPEKFQNQLVLLNFDNHVFKFANKLCPNYKGGYWEFVELPNGAFFAYPDFDGFKDCSCAENYAEGSLNGRLLGIICTMFTLNHITWNTYQTNEAAAEVANSLYYKLRDYIYSDNTCEELEGILGKDGKDQLMRTIYKFLD